MFSILGWGICLIILIFAGIWLCALAWFAGHISGWDNEATVCVCLGLVLIGLSYYVWTCKPFTIIIGAG